MNYELQVVRGRSATTSLKLMDGVNCIGRHDNCQIRIRSTQVSRRHCEVYEAAGKLIVRDLGSSNGTFVNGKKVDGQQVLKVGDVLTVGGVTLRVELIGAPAASPPRESQPEPRLSDTAEVEALTVEEDDDQEEFEIEIDADPQHQETDLIPLVDDESTKPAPPKPTKAAARSPEPAQKASPATESETKKEPEKSKPSAEEEDAVAQFLMDLKLDDDA